MAGWDEKTVIDAIRSHKIISVRGNHDRESFADQLDVWNVDQTADSDFGELINSYRARYVSSLPLFHRFTWDGLRVYLTHGAPWSDTYHVFPTVSADICKRIFASAQADIVILGHTHVPMKLKINDKWIFNPGALSGNRDNLQRTCGILDLPKAEFDIFDVDTRKPIELNTIVIETK